MTTARATRGGWLGLACCLVVVALIAVLAPRPGIDVRRQWDDVGVGQLGTLRLYDAEVTRVRTTTKVAADTYSDPVHSDAVFVVVDLRLRVRERVSNFEELSLLTSDDRSYLPRPEFIAAEPTQTQPGFTCAATLVFELPADRVPGSRLLVEPDSTAFVGYDRGVRVDLGLGRGQIPSPKPVVLDPPRLTVTR